ncbi:recombinase family protein [Rurimicrobium arvi]|uniref:Resolvase/invertase-type recombinase catalytic domain-containing protein n=1 Tax=Rurimicrobium arvi TaxID=2049916 RepID=A0ABP8MW38_9BACT
MKNESFFQQSATIREQPAFANDQKEAVKFARSASREQRYTNLSIDAQNRIIDEYASSNGFTVRASFGGEFESAKTDGRKEFQRMLDYIKKRKGQIGYILIYDNSRFNRIGSNAIKLASDLKSFYGVQVLTVTNHAEYATPAYLTQIMEP